MNMFVPCLLLLVLPTVSFAAGSPKELDDPLALPELLAKDTLELTPRERKALDLSQDWTGRGPTPFISSEGKLIYVHGAAMPTIIASPMQVCDIELQPGEIINEIIVGDSARWLVESGMAGKTAHIFVKPVDVNLRTTAVVTTDRRVYHFRLLSKESNHTPYVGFTYADEMKLALSNRKEAHRQDEERRTGDMGDGRKVDISGLNFAYSVTGKAAWKPERVFDDGEKIYIYLPSGTSELPVLLAKKNGENAMVNYRANGRQLVVDGVFDELSLLLGVGSKREEIIIRRKG